jgi:polyhydroxyalkanoate synthesis regulator phasin
VSAQRSEGPRPASELLLAGLGLASLGAEVADELADDVARRMGIDRDAVRNAVQDTFSAWREEAERLGARRDEVVDRSLRKAGVARQEEVEDLELRVAQLEHRLRLLENPGAPS